jgi:hypothetical protein
MFEFKINNIQEMKKSLLVIIFILITSFGFGQHKYVVKVHGQSGGFEGGTTINGTGFVKANGTTISYDTSTYVSKAVADASYALLTGKSGGQLLNGGTAAGESLTLSSTTNATKGRINFGSSASSWYDENNNNVVLSQTASGHTNTIMLRPDQSTIEQLYDGNPGNFNMVAKRTTFFGDLAVWSDDKVVFASHDGTQTDEAYLQINPTDTNFTIRINHINALKINPVNGNIGINDANATARLQIQAGTGGAGTAPIKLDAGTNLATPENGAVEFDGTNYSVTSNGVRYTLTKTLKGTAAPTITPAAVGIQYVDTTNKTVYISTGTSSLADWKEYSSSEGGTTINGTGFVKANGTTISYDTTTYISQAVANAAFATLTGKSGGQVLNGGTGAGENLTLSSTSNGTKGLIIFGSRSYFDQTNDELHIVNSNGNYIVVGGNGDGRTISCYDGSGNKANLNFNAADTYFGGRLGITNLPYGGELSFDSYDGTNSTYTYMDNTSDGQFNLNVNDHWVYRVDGATGYMAVGDFSGNMPNSQLQTKSFAPGYNETNTAYTLTGNDYTLNCYGSTPYTVTLPDASSSKVVGREYVIINTGSATITITPYSGQTINGSNSSKTLAGSGYKYIHLVASYAGWFVTGGN